MSGHIGIVACSSEGAALCYRTICAESERFMGAHDHLEVSMHNFPLRDYMDFIECDDWRGVGQLMLRSAEKLAAIGADFAICPDNTIHRALRHVGGLSPIPWLDIAEVVARNVAERRYRRVGLLGTAFLLQSDVYPRKLAERGLEWVLPDADESRELTRIILEELVRGVVRPESRSGVQRIISGMQQAGCDAVVLACTELSLLVDDADSPLPTIDSTRLLAIEALNHAVRRLPT